MTYQTAQGQELKATQNNLELHAGESQNEF